MKHVEDNNVTDILLMNKENCALKLVDEIILYYDARSKKHQKVSKVMLNVSMVMLNVSKVMLNVSKLMLNISKVILNVSKAATTFSSKMTGNLGPQN